MQTVQARELELRQRLGECEAARQDCINALAELHFERALKLVQSVARNDTGLREDLEDVAIGALFDAGKTFDANRGVTFWTYARCRLVGRIKMYFRARQRAIPAGLMDESPMEPPAAPSAMSEEWVTEWAAQMLDEVDMLSEPAIHVLLGRATRKDAAEMLGVSYGAFCRRLAPVRKTKSLARFQKQCM